jgi:hypothetical protein
MMRLEKARSKVPVSLFLVLSWMDELSVLIHSCLCFITVVFVLSTHI